MPKALNIVERKIIKKEVRPKITKISAVSSNPRSFKNFLNMKKYLLVFSTSGLSITEIIGMIDAIPKISKTPIIKTTNITKYNDFFSFGTNI